MLTLLYITNDPAMGKTALAAGADRIFLDMETLGKAQRQKNMDTVQSHHTVEDVARMRQALPDAHLLVRIDPLHPGSRAQIEAVLQAGANTLMLPMWKDAGDVAEFTTLVGGRAKTLLLLERKEAAQSLPAVLQQGGFDELHIGLNDLHLSLHRRFMFELLTDGTVEALAQQLRDAGVFFGIGGVARPGGGLVNAGLILPEYLHLGSRMVILSRTFAAGGDFGEGVQALRALEAEVHTWNPTKFDKNRQMLRQAVEAVASTLPPKKPGEE